MANIENKGDMSTLDLLSGIDGDDPKPKKKPEPIKKDDPEYEAWLAKMQKKWLWEFSFTEIGG